MVVPRRMTAAVVDSSVLVKSELTTEIYANEAHELFHDWNAGVLDVHATDLLPSEIGSVFLRALRRGRTSEERAQASIQALLKLPYQLHPSTPLVTRAFEIAYRYDQRIYDCFSVALAEREGMSFWTSDERLCNALQAHLPFIRFIADYVPLL
jgi:predicted nucleic acid-binding protein